MWKKIAETTGARGFQLLVNMGILFWTAQLLGAEGRGVLVAVSTWALTLSTVLGLSVDRVLLHRGLAQEGRAEPSENLGAALWFLIASSIASVVVSGAVYFSPWGGVFGKLPPTLFGVMLAMVPVYSWPGLATALLTTTGHLTAVNRARVYGSIANFTCVVVFVWWLRWGVPAALGAMVAGQAVTGAMMALVLRESSGRPKRLAFAELVNIAKLGGKLHLNTVGNFMRAQVDVLMLNAFLSPTVLGIYHMGSRLVDTMLVVPEAASSTVVEQMGKTSPNSAWPSQKRLMLHLTGLLIALGAVAFALAPTLIPLVLGDDFTESVPVFRLLLPILIGKAIGGVISSQVIARGWFWEASLAGVLVALANVLMNWWLIPSNGMHGAIWSTLVSYGVFPLVLSLLWGLRIERHVGHAMRQASGVVS